MFLDSNCLNSKDCTPRISGIHYYAEVEDSNIAENELQEINKQNPIITRDDSQDTQTSIQIEDKILVTPELHSISSRTDLPVDESDSAYTYDHIVRFHSNDSSLKVTIEQDPTKKV